MRKVLLLIVLAGCCTPRTSSAEEPDAATREGWKQMAQLGKGFVVWESNRTGRWRLWRRELDGSGLRPISPDEAGRDHYCPHLSPDGTRLVYLSYPAGSDTYQERTPNGGVPMYLMHADGSGIRRLAPSARAYGEDRAAVWADNDHLLYIDGEGFTRRIDERDGKSTRITMQGQPDHGFNHGFLVNVTRTHATSGVPTFSLFDASHGRITGQGALEGCQPYFSHDGKWGFWMGGAGGPINRIDLKTRRVSPILRAHDPRMPRNRSYLYFPMVSRDGRLFACAASPNQHDHFKSDYDIFVARMNPRTLEVLGRPVRYSFHPGCDRFPDVFLAGSMSEARGSRPAAAPHAPSRGLARWPGSREGLVYLFETGDKSNQVPSVDGRPERGYTIRPRGRAWLNHDHAMTLAGGSYLVDEANDDLLAACRRSNQMTVEAVIRPARLDQSGPARIVTFSSSSGSRDFTLGQERDRLIFRLRTTRTGENGVNPESTVCTISTEAPLHVAITYRPGQLVGYLDGEEVYRGDDVQGDFSNWAPQHLILGDEYEGNRRWAGTLEGVAIYNRALEPGEIGRDAAGYRRVLQSRKAVPQVEVTARLVAKSPVPTLAEIKPYRDALMVSKYRVTSVVRGTLKDREVLVTQWALLDGQPQPAASRAPGVEARMILEPFEANPQLARFVCKDGFDGDRELLLPRYFDAAP